MKKRDILIICLILCFICSLQAVAASDVDDTSIGTTDNDVVSIENVSAYSLPGADEALQESEYAVSFTELQNVVENGGANFADHNYTCVDGDPTGGITLRGTITLDGQGKVIIDAQNHTRIFKIAQNANVTLRGITFINANTTGPGGSILVNGEVHIENCNFFDNTATYGNGGAVFINNTGSGSTITGSSFERNRAINNGQDGVGAGAAIFIRASHTAISHSTFTYNYAGLNGGAIASMPSINNCTIANCTFEHNTANGSAGAVGMQIANFKMYNSTFRYNEARGVTLTETYPGNGGGIVLRAGGSTVYNCTFEYNTARLYGGASFVTNTSDGAINNYTGFEHCTFNNNTATLGSGGAIQLVARATSSYIKDSNFTNNTAHTNGGAVYWIGTQGNINGSTFTNNIANRSGGAVYWRGSDGNITDSVFTNNSAKGDVYSEDSYGGYTWGGNGGAIMWVGSDGYVHNTTFINNTAYGHDIDGVIEGGKGGAVYLQGSSDGICNNTKFDNCTFIDNFAQVNGGAVDWYVGAMNGLVNNSIFTNNMANRSGGAVFWSGKYGNITNSNFTGNHAYGISNATDSYGENNTGGNGGAVMWVGPYGNVYNCTFENNTAVKYGGGVYLQGGSVNGNCTNTTFDYCKFINNTAGWNGGAIDWHEGAHDGLVNNTIFTNNIAKSNGGAIYWEGVDGNILNSNFTSNHALGDIIDNEQDQGDGGAVIWAGNNGFVDNCWFKFNTAAHRGGAVYLHGFENSNNNTRFSNSHFINNTAGTNGGAVDWHNGATYGYIYNTEFINNTAKRNGGSIFWHGENGVINQSTFINNRATGEAHEDPDFDFNMDTDIELITTSIDSSMSAEGYNASKLYVVNETNGNIAHFESWIIKNGAWKQLDEIDINISDSKISPIDWAVDQFFGGDGGSILWTGDYGLVINCTFIDSNSARRGGGAYMTGSDNITFDNCTFINCTSGTNGGGVDWLAGANYGKIYNCVFNHTQAARSAGAIYYDGWYGDMQNITIINTISHGGDDSFRTIKGDLITYAGWDSSHWDTNTTGGDAGAIMFTGSNINVTNVTFINCVGAGRGGAVFLQDNQNVTFELCTFENNLANGTSKNTWNDDKNPTPETLNPWLTGNGGAIAFDVGATLGVIKYCNFTNNTAVRLGGAIDYAKGSSFGSIENSIFENNTAFRNGGAIAFDGTNCTVYNSNFTNNSALGTDIDRTLFDLTSLDLIKSISTTGTVDKSLLEGKDHAYMYVVNKYNETTGKNDTYTMFVWVNDVNDWVQLEETTETGPSYMDWAMDEYFGGTGGTIYWRGDNGTVDNCNFIDSNSARRGGGAYMTGSDNITFSNCNFTNCTSGTNGGGVDWLAGANNGAVINCTFNNTRAARSAGAIYYDGDWGRMENITIINATAHGGLDLFASDDGRVIYATWDSSHWDGNTTGGDAGAIMFTGNYETVYNVTFINCTAVGRGGAVFLQDNHNVTFELCTFINNTALGTATNTWESKIVQNSDETDLEKLTGHGGAIGFDTNAMNCTITNSEFTNNFARRNGGAINFDVNSDNNTIKNSVFTNNTVWDDGGAINIDHGSDWCSIDNCTFTNNTGLGKGGSTTKGGTICLNGDYVSISNSTFTLGIAYADEGAKVYQTDAGAIFITGNNVNVTDCNFTNCSSPNVAGAIKIIGNYTKIVHCIVENCTAGREGNIGNASGIYIEGHDALITNSRFAYLSAPEMGGAIYVAGENATINESEFYLCNATIGGAIYIEGNDTYVLNSNFTNCSSTESAGAIHISGNDANVNGTLFTNCTTDGFHGGAICISGNFTIVFNTTFEKCEALGSYYDPVEKDDILAYGGAMHVSGNNATIIKANFNNNNVTGDGAALYVDGHYCNVYNSTFTNNTAGDDGGAIYWRGNHGNMYNITCYNNTGISSGNSSSNGGSICIQGYNITVAKSNFTLSSAQVAGGAIFVTGNFTNITDSTFDLCSVSYDYGGDLSRKTYVNGGGALYIIGDYSNVLNCNLTNSNAKEGGSIYIQGHDVTVDNARTDETYAQNGGSIYVKGDNATISNSDIKNSDAYYVHGGAILVNGTNTRIISSNFTDCTAVKYGGAIFINGFNATVEKSRFTNNYANNQTNDGAGGSIFIEGNNVEISDSYMAQSEAVYGGAICVNGNHAVIDNITTEDTHSIKDGGVIYIGNPAGTGANTGVNTTIKNSNITIASAGEYGGAVYIKANNAKIIDSNFTRTNSVNSGGAIYIDGQHTVIDGAVVKTAYAEVDGGAIYIGNPNNNKGYNTTIKNSNFTDCNATSSGGAIYIKGTHAKVINSTFNQTYSKINLGKSENGKGGGAIYIWGNNANISDCEFESSFAYYGGVIYSYGSNSRVYNSNFTNNVARQSGGAIYWYGGNQANNNSVIGCLFLNNTAYVITSGNNEGGGAIYWSTGTQHGSVKDSTFINNSVQTGAAKADGGAILWDESYHALIDNCIFDGNFVNGTTDLNGGSTGWVQGGAVFFRARDNYTISNSIFENCWTTKDGGALYISNRGSAGTMYSLKIYNTTFINNTIKPYGENHIYGGGAVQLKEAHSILFDNVTFVNNSANYGGAIRIYNPNSMILSLNNCNFTGNNATVDGGSIYIHTEASGDTKFNFNNFTISNSHADGNGGGIYSKNLFQYSNFTFINNSAVQGGGLYWDVVGVEIKDMTFINNTATDGGAVYIAKDSAKVLNNNFTNNSADYGGAIYVYSNSVEVGYNNFTKNSAEYGGAIYERVIGNTIDIHDSSFDENNGDYGGAIYAGFTKVDSQINRCNFTNNTALDGGAIYIAGSNQKVYNCTFEGNNATRNGGAIYANASLSGVEIKDSTFKNSHADNGGAIYNLGSRSFGVTIENDIFTKNTAEYNGGAVLYINNGKIYRDYNNFDTTGVIEGGRTSVSEGSTTFIKTSLFEDNNDYIFSIQALPDSEVKSLLITLNQPNNFDPTTGKKFKWVVNITNASGFFREVIVTEENYISYYHNGLDGKYLFVTFDEGLVRGETYNMGSWFNTTYFDDESFITKENFTAGTVQGSAIGQFAILQDQIQRNISQQKDNGKDYYIIELNRLSYRFTNDVDVHDDRCMNITDVDRPLIIIGNGCILDARGFSRIFNITASNVTFVNITFTGGNASAQPYGDGVDYGGAIFWAGANGTLDHCIIDDNRAYVGGGIYYAPSASDCKIINSTFINNFADTNGGAIDCNASRMNLTSTVFDSNHAYTGAALCRETNATGGFGYGNNFTNNVAGYAGAALAWINASSISIDNYYFYNNKAGYSGGALYVGEGSGSCNVTNCVFDNNYVDTDGDDEIDINDAGSHGGAIEWYAGEGLVLNSTFTNNKAYDGGAIYVGEGSDNINITNSNFTENRAVTTGGAIGVVSSNVTINSSNFYYNNATSGAALFIGGQGTTNYVYSSNFVGNKANGGNGGAIEWVASSGHVVDSNFTGNCAYNGGALYFGGESAKSSVSGCNFTDNHAIFLGGAIDANASGMNLTNTVFDKNTAQFGAALCRETNATGGFGYNNVFTNNHAYVSGAALGWMASVNITITNYTFINNTADVSGGAIFVGPNSHNCSIISSTFENNYVTNKTTLSPDGFSWDTWDDAGAEFSVEPTNDPNMAGKLNMDQTNRITTYYYWHSDDPSNVLGVGGAIDCLASNATIKDSNFTNNTAKFGGALNVAANSGNTNIAGSIFTNNTAYEDGGAINLFASAVNVNNSYFYDNDAFEGGAIYVGGVGTTNQILSSVFEGNNATARGGAIYWIAYAGVIDNSNFTNNFANDGGAVYLNLNSGNSNITNSIFRYNNATHYGGAIDCNSTNMGLYNTTFEFNEAEYGAALAREVHATGGHGNNNTFIANHARVSGAALAWLSVDSVKIYNYTFINNTAERSGGAIYVDAGSDNCLVFNSTFEGNHLTNMSDKHFGGAIDCVGNNLTVNMSSFTNNGAYDGGAIYLGTGSGSSHIYNSTFTSNYAYGDGGAIGLKASGVDIDISRFYNNTAERNGGALFLGNGTDNTIDDSLFDGNIAQQHGGAIECNTTSVSISNTNFTYNEADYGAALCREVMATGGHGGNNTFIGNHAYTAGAALAWLGADQITITNYTFINNTAGVMGGAIYVQEDSENCTVRNSTFTGNHVTDFEEGLGGAICWLGPNALINNTNFTNSYTAYGGAVYVGPNSDNFTVMNVSFNISRAFKEGGAIVLQGDNARFISSNFTQSLALDEGGAIDAHGITNLTIYDCIFDHDVGAGDVGVGNVIYGRGGALYLDNITLINISNTKFIHIESHGDGGAIYAVNCNDSMLYNLTFDYGVSVEHGGFIAWFDSTNVTVDSSSFNDTEGYFGGGAIYLENMYDTFIKHSQFNSSSSPYGNGGALYMLNGEVEVFNCTFNVTSAQKGGAIYIGGNATVHNITAYDSRASVDGGVIYIEYDNVTVTNFTSDDSIATGDGGVVYINANNVSLINFTTSNSEAIGNAGVAYINGDNITVDNFKSSNSATKEKGGAFYVNGNVTMNNLTLDNYDAKSGDAIYFAAGNSTLSNSTLIGPNAIYVNKNVTVYLMKNNITGVGANKDTWYLVDNSSYAVSKVDYSVWSDGILYLDQNTFDYIIFNNGTIKSPTHIYMLGNETWNNTVNDTFIFWAHIVDDLNNTIISVSSLNSSNQLYPDMSFAMPYNCIPLQTYLQGVFYLRAFDNSLEDCDERNGTLYVKMPTKLVVEVGDEVNEEFTITVKITTPIDSNWTVMGQTVHIKFGDDEFDININSINGYLDGDHWVWDVANATFTKEHLHTGTYMVTATYDGDGNHWGSENYTLMVVNSRPIWISAHAEDIFYNETLYINVTSNATNTENGRITIRIDGKVYSIGLKLNDTGNGINETEEYFEWGYIVRDGVHDGLYIVPNKNFTQTLLPGEHTIEVMFDGGTYYGYQTNTSTFTVKKLTTDILVEYENITYGQDELINVTVNENATGYISIRIGNNIYTSPINQGIARFNITGLAVGTYTNINVTYYPVDDSGFSRNVTNFTFKVDPISDYLIDITVDEITYGQNATVRVFIPDATGEVTIYVDDNRIDNATLERGIAVLENIVGPDGLPLVGGQHSVRVVYEGCSIYGPNENSTTFTVGPTDNWDMTIPRITSMPYGENISIIVNTTGYNLAHDHVNITIDGIIYPVSIINGIANLTLNNLSAGSHAAFVEYGGDDNYAYKNKTFYVTVNQTTPTVTITHEGGNVIATVSGNTTGTVTFHVYNANGEEHVDTITINNEHQAIFEDVLNLGYNFINAEYNGDKNYTTKTAVTSIFIELTTTSLTVNATPVSVFEGNNVTINVTMVNVTTGRVLIEVGNYNYTVNIVDGVVLLNLTLPAGEYHTKAYYLGDLEHTPCNATGNDFTVVARSTPVITIEINDGPYYVGDNVTVTVKVDGVVAPVNVTINGTPFAGTEFDGVNFTIPVNGTYTIVASTTENVTHNNASAFVVFSAIKRDPGISVGVVGDTHYVDTNVEFNIDILSNSTEVVVSVGDDVVSGNSYHVNANGTYTVVVRVAENDWYYGGNVSATFTVVKYNAEITGIVSTTGDVTVGYNATVNVTMGNVTSGKLVIEVGSHNYTVDIVDSVARLNVTLPAGEYGVKAYFLGDYKYNATSIDGSVIKFVGKSAPVITITVQSGTHYVGDYVEISAEADNGAAVTVLVDGNALTDGKYHVLSNGTYTVTATTEESDDYVVGWNSTSFIVVKHDPNVVITVVGDTHYVGDDVEFTVTKDTTATVVLTVGDVVLENNKYPTVANGTYTVVATVVENDYYYGGTFSTTFTVVKRESSITKVDVDSSVVVGNNVTVNVTVGNGIVSGSVVVEIAGVNYTVPVDVNGYANLSVALPVGDYVAHVYYAENTKYNASGVVTSAGFSVVGVNVPTIEITIETPGPYYVGDEVEITAVASNGASVTIVVNGTTLGAGGKYTIGSNGTYVVTATTVANETDGAGWNFTVFNVIKRTPSITITVDEGTHYVDTNIGITVTIVSDGTLLVKVGDEVIDGVFHANANGTYTITATTTETDKYYAGANSATFTVVKYNAEITGIVSTTGDVTVGYNATVNVTMGNVTSGKLVIEVGSHNYTVDIVDSVARLNVTLPAGEYGVKAYFLGDYKYNATSIDGSVIKFVGKSAPVITITVQSGTHYVGDYVEISAEADNGAAVTVLVDGNALTDGKYHVLSNGTYTVTATTEESDDYVVGWNSTSFIVVKHDPNVVITVVGDTHYVGDDVEFTVTKDTTATVVLTVGDVVLENNKYPTVANGTYTVVATVVENDYYYGGTFSTTFTVVKRESSITKVDVDSSVVVGNNVTVNVTVGNGIVSGSVVVEIAGVNYTVPVDVNGYANLSVALPVGDYVAHVYYAENTKYNASGVVTSAGFSVVGVNVPTIEITIETPGPYYVGDEVEITAVASNGASVTIVVNGTTLGAGGKYTIGSNGTYVVTATTVANETDGAGWNFTVFNVIKRTPSITITVDEGTHYVDTNIGITVTIVSDGTLLVKVGDEVIDGVFHANANGTYTITATTTETDKYYAGANSATFTVVKYNAQITGIESTTGEVTVGYNATVNVTMGNVTSGKLVIEVGSHNYTVDIVDSVARLNVTLPAGEYSVKAYFLGDYKYNATSIDGSVIKFVGKSAPEITISLSPAGPYYVDGTVTVSVEVNGVPVDISAVNLTVDGVKSTTGVVDLTHVGSYSVVVTTEENETYVAGVNSTTFAVVKHTPVISIDNVGTHYVGDTFTIHVNNDTVVNVTVDGVAYDLDASGNVLIDSTALVAGSHIVKVTVVENDNYYGKSANTTFEVVKCASEIGSVVVDPTSVDVGNNVTVTVTMNGGITSGNVIVEIAGVNYTAPVGSDGKASFSVELPVGDYVAHAYYAENDKYNASDIVPSNDFSVVDVDKAVPVITISVSPAGPYFVGNTITITALVDGAVAPVNITVDGVKLTTSTLTLDHEGSYSIVATTAENATHKEGWNSTTIYANKLASSVTISIEGNNIVATVNGDATGNVTFYLDGVEHVEDISYGRAVYEGAYSAELNSIVAVYNGDDTYEGSSDSMYIAKQTPNIKVEVGSPKVVGEDITIKVTGPSDIDGNATVRIDNKEYLVNLHSGVGQVTLPYNLTKGHYDINVTYLANSKYASNVNSTQLDVVQDTSITVDVKFDNITVGENVILNVTLPGDASGTITYRVGTHEDTVPVHGGLNRIVVSGLGTGDYIVNVTYNGNDRYPSITSENDLLNVASSSAMVLNVKDLNNGTVIVTLPDPSAGGTVDVQIGTQTFSAPVENGVAVVELDGITPGKYDATVVYEDGYGIRVETDTLININRYASPIRATVSNINVGGTEVIVVTLPGSAGGKVTVQVDGIVQTKDLVGGSVTFTITGLMEGSKTAVITYGGDSNYTDNYTTAKFTVSKINPSIYANSSTDGDYVILTAYLPSDATGQVLFDIGGVGYYANVVNGVATVSVPNGNMATEAVLTYTGNYKYNSAVYKVKFNATKHDAFINVNARDISVGDVESITISVPSDATGNVTVVVGGKTYVANISNGVAIIEISGLAKGTYNIEASYSGDDNYSSAVNNTVSFTVGSSIVTTIVTRGYNSSYDYYATFLDESDNPLANTPVQFIAGGKTYNVTTNGEGVAYLPGASLLAGNHTVIAVNPVTDFQVYGTAIIVPRIQENKDLVMDFCDGSFRVRVYGDDGKPVGAGEVVTMAIYVGENCVIYNVTTNENGYAIRSIGLSPGSYTIKTSYKGYEVVNALTVKSTLSAKSITVKKSAKTTKFTATLKHSNGKAISGKTIKFRFNGKTYSAKTNSKGVATIKIKSSMVKKLKVGKSYAMKVTYEKMMGAYKAKESVNVKIKIAK